MGYVKSGTNFNIKPVFQIIGNQFQYKTCLSNNWIKINRSSYLYGRNPYTVKMASLYWQRPVVTLVSCLRRFSSWPVKSSSSCSSSSELPAIRYIEQATGLQNHYHNNHVRKSILQCPKVYKYIHIYITWLPGFNPVSLYSVLSIYRGWWGPSNGTVI